MLTHQLCGLIQICLNQPRKVKRVLLIWVVMKDQNCRRRGSILSVWNTEPAHCNMHSSCHINKVTLNKLPRVLFLDVQQQHKCLWFFLFLLPFCHFSFLGSRLLWSLLPSCSLLCGHKKWTDVHHILLPCTSVQHFGVSRWWAYHTLYVFASRKLIANFMEEFVICRL